MKELAHQDALQSEEFAVNVARSYSKQYSSLSMSKSTDSKQMFNIPLVKQWWKEQIGKLKQLKVFHS
jgi:hypothetical protein